MTTECHIVQIQFPFIEKYTDFARKIMLTTSAWKIFNQSRLHLSRCWANCSVCTTIWRGLFVNVEVVYWDNTGYQNRGLLPHCASTTSQRHLFENLVYNSYNTRWFCLVWCFCLGTNCPNSFEHATAQLLPRSTWRLIIWDFWIMSVLKRLWIFKLCSWKFITAITMTTRDKNIHRNSYWLRAKEMHQTD